MTVNEHLHIIAPRPIYCFTGSCRWGKPQSNDVDIHASSGEAMRHRQIRLADREPSGSKALNFDSGGITRISDGSEVSVKRCANLAYPPSQTGDRAARRRFSSCSVSNTSRPDGAMRTELERDTARHTVLYHVVDHKSSDALTTSAPRHRRSATRRCRGVQDRRGKHDLT